MYHKFSLINQVYHCIRFIFSGCRFLFQEIKLLFLVYQIYFSQSQISFFEHIHFFTKTDLFLRVNNSVFWNIKILFPDYLFQEIDVNFRGYQNNIFSISDFQDIKIILLRYQNYFFGLSNSFSRIRCPFLLWLKNVILRRTKNNS